MPDCVWSLLWESRIFRRFPRYVASEKLSKHKFLSNFIPGKDQVVLIVQWSALDRISVIPRAVVL